jgi:hypothetical protein
MDSLDEKIKDHLYNQLRLTISDFDRIPSQIINDEIRKASQKIRILNYKSWKEEVMYDGKSLPFFMLVFEVKKNILSNWR